MQAHQYAGLAREPAFCPRWKPTIKNPNVKTFDSSQILVHLRREELDSKATDSKANEAKAPEVVKVQKE